MRGHGPALTGLTRLQKDSEGDREGYVVAQEHRGQPSQSSALRVTLEVSERPDKVGWVRRPPEGAAWRRGLQRDGGKGWTAGTVPLLPPGTIPT